MVTVLSRALYASGVARTRGCTPVIGRWLWACCAVCFLVHRDAYSSDVLNVTFETAMQIHSNDSDRYKTVYRVDLGKMQVAGIHRTDYDQIADLAVSPDKDSVAVLATRLRFIDGVPEVHNKVTVIDAQGQVKYEILGASEGIAWSPDGKALAYTMGTHVEGEGFHSTGTFCRDSITGESERIYDKGLFLHWAAFDKRLYIMNDYNLGEVVVYDPVNHSVNETPYKTIHLSPNGKFYYVWNGGLVRLVSTEDGADLTSRYAFLHHPRTQRAPWWLNEHLLAFSGLGHCTHLFYIADGRTLKVPGKALAIRGDDIYVSVPTMQIDKLDIKEAEEFISEEEGLLSPDEQKN